jgi:hypothetical protein
VQGEHAAKKKLLLYANNSFSALFFDVLESVQQHLKTRQPSGKNRSTTCLNKGKTILYKLLKDDYSTLNMSQVRILLVSASAPRTKALGPKAKTVCKLGLQY